MTTQVSIKLRKIVTEDVSWRLPDSPFDTDGVPIVSHLPRVMVNGCIVVFFITNKEYYQLRFQVGLQLNTVHKILGFIQIILFNSHINPELIEWFQTISERGSDEVTVHRSSDLVHIKFIFLFVNLDKVSLNLRLTLSERWKITVKTMVLSTKLDI